MVYKEQRDQDDQEGEIKESTGNGKFDSKCMICVFENVIMKVIN